MSRRGKGALLLGMAFLLGVGAGALGLDVYRARTAWGPDRAARAQAVVLQRLTRELGLTPAQQAQVEAILRATGVEFARLREEMRPRFSAIRDRSRIQILAVLTPEQQPKFDALAAEWERRWERRRGEAQGTPGRAPERP